MSKFSLILENDDRETLNTTHVLTNVAKNPATASPKLEQLALISDELASLVAANPNASLLTLTALAVRFPQQVLLNPVLDLLALENSECVLQLFNPNWRNLLDRPNVPKLLIESAVLIRDPFVWYAILEHPTTPLEILEQIDNALMPRFSSGSDCEWPEMDAPSRIVRLAVLRHPNASSEMIDAGLHLFERDVAKLFAHPNAPAWLGALLRSEPGVSARNQARFIRFKSPPERLHVAMYRHASAEVLDELAKSSTGFDELQMAIAENPNVSISTLERIAHHHKNFVAVTARHSLKIRSGRGGEITGRLFWPVSVSHAMMHQTNSDMSRGMREMRLQQLQENKTKFKTPPVRGGIYLLKRAGSCLVKLIQTEGQENSGTVRACHWYWQVKPIACDNPRTLRAIKTWVRDIDVRRDLPGRVESWSLEEFNACEPLLLEVCPVKESELEVLRSSGETNLWGDWD
jgi:hypothetical protein